MRILALANQKGGVGKTATTTGLASAISARGGRCLIIDLDPQGNATTGLGVHLGDGDPTADDIMARLNTGGARHSIISTPWQGVDLIGANLDLASVEKSTAEDIPWRLKLALQGLDLEQHYDAVLIDCPPSLGRLLFAALIASHGVIAVTEPTVDSVRGIRNLEETVGIVQQINGGQPAIDRIVVSRKRNTGEHRFREDELREAYGDLVARTTIPELAARQDAHSTHTPMHEHRGGKALSLQVAYDSLADELGLIGRNTR